MALAALALVDFGAYDSYPIASTPSPDAGAASRLVAPGPACAPGMSIRRPRLSAEDTAGPRFPARRARSGGAVGVLYSQLLSL